MNNPLDEMYGIAPAEPNPLDEMYGIAPAPEKNPLDEMYRQELESLVYKENPISAALKNTLYETGGMVMKAIEPLDRPRAAIVAALGDRPAGSVTQALKGEIHPSWGELMPEKITIPQYEHGGLLGRGAGRKEDLDVKPAAALAADIIADPLNLLGVGTLTKLGKSGKILGNIAKVHGEDLGKIIGSTNAVDILNAIRTKNPAVTGFLKSKGIKDATIEVAGRATQALFDTLPEQAKAGQWAFARLGPVTTPRFVNVPAAKGIEAVRNFIPKTPIGKLFSTRTGDDVFDRGAREIDRIHQTRKNDIMGTGMDLRKKIDDLGPDAFGKKSSAAWYESEGGVWLDRLLNRDFGARPLPGETLNSMRRVFGMKSADDLTNEGLNTIVSLTQKEFPEINGVRPFFAPGGNDPDMLSYAMHNIAGGKKQVPQKMRVAALHMAEDSLRNPDFIFSQPNGNRFFGTVYDMGGKERMHVVITEMENNGRVREVTQFLTGSRGSGSGRVERIASAIRKKFDDSTLEYVGGSIKQPHSQGSSLVAASSPRQLPGPESSGDGANILTPQGEAVKLGIAQDVMRQNRSQLDEMAEWGIPIEEISEQGYSYAPHIAAKKEGLIDRLYNALDRRRTSTYTPHRLQRDIRWIKDPNSGQEFIDSVSRYAHQHGIKADSLVTRQASVDEINKAFGKDFFKGDLAESVTIAALRNERALHGARQLEYFITKAQEDLAKAGGVAPDRWRTPRLATPKRYIVDDGKPIDPIILKLDQLRNTPMAPEKARFIEARWKSIARPDEAAKELKEFFSGYTSLWKRYTLFPFMEYHFRNMVGDLWNGWMNGWKPREIMGDVYEAMLIQRGKNPMIKGAGVYGDLQGNALKRAAEEYGVIGSGQYGEISNLLTPIESKKGIERMKSEFWNLDTPVAAGQFLEDNRRLGLFKRRVQNGDTFEEAASAVKKALYDYNDLTDFEKEVRRWLIPFYTWYRKNLPAQIENLIRRPGKVNVLPKAKAHIEGADKGDIPEELRPAWMRRGFSIHTGQDEHGNENFAILGSYIPTADLFSFGGGEDDLLTGLISNLNPLIKVPVELSGNKNYFFERPVDRLRDKDAGIFGKGGTLWGNERTDFLGANLPTSAVKLLELLPFTRLLSTLDRLNPFGIFDEGEDFDPAVLREGQIKTRPYHTEMDTLPKLMKAITGLKIYPVDIHREVAFKIDSLKKELADIKYVAKKATMEGDTESVKRYQGLVKDLTDKLERYTALYDRYTESRR